MRIYETTDICFDEIYCWCGDVWGIDIRACWHDVLVAWVVDDGNTFRTYADDGRSDANLIRMENLLILLSMQSLRVI